MRYWAMVVCVVMGVGGGVRASETLMGENLVFFSRGDSNGDGVVNVSDPAFTGSFLFQGGPSPSCMDAADANDDGVINNADTAYALSWLYTGGSAPPAPGAFDCGFDPTPDQLSCEYHVCME